MLYGFSDIHWNHEDYASLADDVHANAAAIKVGYPHTAGGPEGVVADAAIAANEANGLTCVVNLWTTDETFGGQPDPVSYYAARVAEAAARWPDVLIELVNEPNFPTGAFGDWTPESIAEVAAAATEAAPGRVIGPAISPSPPFGYAEYFAWQTEMYDEIESLLGGDLEAAGMIGVGTHMYPNQQHTVEAEIEDHIAQSSQWGVPVYVTEIGWQWGWFGDHVNPTNLQPVKAAEMWERYYHDERVGGIFIFRLAVNPPENGGIDSGDTFQRFPLSTNVPMQDALEAAWGAAPPVTAIDSSGHHRTGFYENVTGTPGTVSPDDGAAEFNGTNSVVTSLYDPWGGPFTLEAWVRTDSTASHRTIFGSAPRPAPAVTRSC